MQPFKGLTILHNKGIIFSNLIHQQTVTLYFVKSEGILWEIWSFFFLPFWQEYAWNNHLPQIPGLCILPGHFIKSIKGLNSDTQCRTDTKAMTDNIHYLSLILPSYSCQTIFISVLRNYIHVFPLYLYRKWNS
jgi:hypothetical protein